MLLSNKLGPTNQIYTHMGDTCTQFRITALNMYRSESSTPSSISRIQPIWLQKLPLVFFTSIFFLLQHPSVSFSFPLTSLSFGGIVVSGFHFPLTCLFHYVLHTQRYDWHSALATCFLFFFFSSFFFLPCFPIVIPCQCRTPRLSLKCHDNVQEKCDGA